MNNAEYWKKRALEMENSAHNVGLETQRQIEKVFNRAQVEINNKIAVWYTRLADNNNLSITEAKKLLRDNELEEFKWTVEDYIEYGQENKLNGQWIKQLENASAKVHISRLEAMKLQIQQQLERAYGNELDSLDKLIRKSYTESYYKTIYEVQKAFNIGYDIAGIDPKLLDKIVYSPWNVDGKNFSNRIWQHKTVMTRTLQDEMLKGILVGSSPDKAINHMSQFVSKKFKHAKSQAACLVQTEQAYFSSLATKDSYKELGVEEFEILATLDSHTSEICQKMDGKHFPLSKYRVGVTAPPFHPRCRTTTVPYFNDEFTAEEMRIARGEDGKTYHVPADMTYKEWKKAFVDGGSKEGLEELLVEQTPWITKKSINNKFTVDRALANTKQFHDKFENLTNHKAVNEALYQESLKILEHRDGTDFEDLVVLDAKTGKLIVKNDTSIKSDATGLTNEQYNIYKNYDCEKILLHNHPNSSRISYRDLSTLFEYNDVIGTAVVGHDGSVNIAFNPNRKFDIDEMYKRWYDENMKKYDFKDVAELRSLDELYSANIFEFRSR